MSNVELKVQYVKFPGETENRFQQESASENKAGNRLNKMWSDCFSMVTFKSKNNHVHSSVQLSGFSVNAAEVHASSCLLFAFLLCLCALGSALSQTDTQTYSSS